MDELKPKSLDERFVPGEIAYVSDDEINLKEILGIVWAEKKLISIVTSIALLISITVSLMLPEIYRAEIVLAQADTEQGASGLLSQLGGAAALLGVDVGSNSGDHLSTAIAVLQSRQFINQFIERNNMLIPLFAEKWNKIEQIAEIDSSIYSLDTNEWLLKNGQPSEEEAYQKFRNALTVSGPDRNTGIITAALTWHNPKEAAAWLNSLIEDLNQNMRMRDVKEASNAITYLQKQLESTQLVDLRQVFYQLIESQTRITMLADVRDEYVFRVIDPAVTPERKIEPRRSLIVIFGTLLGFMFSLLCVYVLQVLRNWKVISVVSKVQKSQ